MEARICKPFGGTWIAAVFDNGIWNPFAIALGIVVILGVSLALERGPLLNYATSGLHRAALILLALIASAGFLVMANGLYLSHSRAISGGAAVTLVSGAIFVFFSWLGRRELRHRSSGNANRANEEEPK